MARNDLLERRSSSAEASSWPVEAVGNDERIPRGREDVAEEALLEGEQLRSYLRVRPLEGVAPTSGTKYAINGWVRSKNLFSGRRSFM